VKFPFIYVRELASEGGILFAEEGPTLTKYSLNLLLAIIAIICSSFIINERRMMRVQD